MKQPMLPDEYEATILAAIRKGAVLVLVVPPALLLKGLQHWTEDSGDGEPAVSANPVLLKKDIYSRFEREFGRTLSPIEIETINGWVDEDHYADELILAALKEAVFASKLHIRYVDTTLLDWHRNQITTVDQAKIHAQKFRGRKGV